MVLVAGGIMTVFLAQPTEAQARPWRNKGYHKQYSYNRHHNSHHDYYPYSFVRLAFPFSGGGYINLSVGGRKYYYKEGSYYRKKHRRYYTVTAPIGACVEYLPYGYQTIYVDGYTYYTYNGAYYDHTPNGYVVIDKPTSKRVKKYRTQKNRTKAANKRAEREGTITLNIENKKGEYISVIIEPSGNGYVGPQGEYYDEFPKVEHLKVIYGS